MLVNEWAIRGIGCGIVDQDVETAEVFQGEVNAAPGGVFVSGVRCEPDCTADGLVAVSTSS